MDLRDKKGRSTMKRKAILMWELVLYTLMTAIIFLVGIVSLRSYYSFQFDVKREQMVFIDAALEDYAVNHLMVDEKDTYIDEDGKTVSKNQKTYPEKLDELIDLGYINEIENMEDFTYTPHKEGEHYTYYELKTKKPLSNSYFISPGSTRSEYMADNN
jgi:hypothetical protein